MKYLFSSFKETTALLRKDKISMVVSLGPVLLGVLLYSVVGKYIFVDLMNVIRSWIGETIGTGFWDGILNTILIGLLSIGMYFIVTWTFILVVSLIASPFHDQLSGRMEKLVKGEVPASLTEGLWKSFQKFFQMIINEVKKISFILLMTLVAFFIGLLPILAPISICLTAILLAVGFVDYTWSRHDLSFSQCFRDIKINLLGYTISGGIFLLLLAIPIVNLFVMPYAVAYYAVFYTRNYS